VRDTGGKGKRYMKKKISIKYRSEPISARVIADFLPKPEKLALRKKHVKVTLSLTQKSVDFFKKAARKNSDSYQSMIRRLIDYYVVHQ